MGLKLSTWCETGVSGNLSIIIGSLRSRHYIFVMPCLGSRMDDFGGGSRVPVVHRGINLFAGPIRLQQMVFFLVVINGAGLQQDAALLLWQECVPIP